MAARNHAWSINRLGQTGDLTAVLSSEARLCFATSSVALTETRSNISTKVKRSSTCRLLEVDRKPPACGRNDAHNPIRTSQLKSRRLVHCLWRQRRSVI